MTDVKQATFDGWAIVDVLGHQRYVGYVTTEAYGQAVLFRVDVPALEPRERITKAPGHIEDPNHRKPVGDGFFSPQYRYVPAGTTVHEGAVAGYSKLIGAGSIYAITPCTKEAALEAVEAVQPRPLMSVTLPPGHELPPAESYDDAQLAGAGEDEGADSDDD